MKKFLTFMLCIIIGLQAFVLPAGAALYTPAELYADTVYMISLDNGAVITDINGSERRAPASITKIVTAILTIENCTDFEKVITAPSYCIRLLDGTNSSTAGILVGEELTVRELLYCLLVYSANDAANILADFIGGGSIDNFITMMNDFAAGLGCTGTHFVNAHGLDDEEHYTTAADLATMYAYCLKNSMFAEIAGTYSYDIPATNKYKETRYLRNTNGLLNSGISDYYYEYAKNGKTGTTDDAGRCLISSASKDGYNYLCVVLGAQFFDVDEDGVNENMAIIQSKRMYQWAFSNLRIREVANPSTYVCEAKVELGKEYDYVSLVPAKSVSALVPSGVDAESVLVEPIADVTITEADAPVKKGEILGRATIKYADSVVAEVDLAAAFDVSRSTPKLIVYTIKKMLKSTFFKLILLVICAIVVPVCFVFFVWIPAERRKKKDTVRIVKVNDMKKKK